MFWLPVFTPSILLLASLNLARSSIKDVHGPRSIPKNNPRIETRMSPTRYQTRDTVTAFSAACRETRTRRKLQRARGIIIHPAHYPSTDTIHEPTLIHHWSLLDYPLSHSTRWKFSGIIRDLRRGKRASSPPPRYLPRFIRDKDEQCCLSFLPPLPLSPPIFRLPTIIPSGVIVYSPCMVPFLHLRR